MMLDMYFTCIAFNSPKVILIEFEYHFVMSNPLYYKR